MMDFAIEPRVGPLPVRFGMAPADIELLLGPPTRVFDSPRLKIKVESRQMVSLGYLRRTGLLIEAVFSEDARLLFGGVDLLKHPDPVGFLRAFDPVPMAWMSTIIFLNLGISLVGYIRDPEQEAHDPGEGTAISVNCPGYYDELSAKLSPFS